MNIGRQTLRHITTIVRRFSDRAFGISDIRNQLYQLRWQQGYFLLKDLLAETRYDEPLRLQRFGYKIFSQEDEDGILAEIFKRIGTDTRQFLEIGVDNGWECNTCALLYQGWSGVWVEGNPKSVASIKTKFADRIANGQLEVQERFVTREFTAEIMRRWPSLAKIDLFSLDIDGNDYHIIEAMPEIEAEVVVVEYDAKHRPPIDWFMPYRADHIWDGSDWLARHWQRGRGCSRKRGMCWWDATSPAATHSTSGLIWLSESFTNRSRQKITTNLRAIISAHFNPATRSKSDTERSTAARATAGRKVKGAL